jgi:diguanylate cyclase (GGDEF)-like protein/PAS domain S-box-containing protein
VYLVMLVAGAGLVERAATGNRAVLQSRFDVRVSTATVFVDSYVADVFRRESDLAGRRLAGRVTEQQFLDLTADLGFQAAVLLDERGRLAAVAPANPALIGTDLTGRYAHLSGAAQGRPTVSGVVPAAADGQPVIGFAVPFDTPTGRRVFSGAYTAARTPLQAYLAHATQLRGGEAYLLDGQGTVITAGGRRAATGRTLAGANPGLAAVVAAHTSGTAVIDGSPMYFSTAAVAGTSWRLVFAVPSAVLFEPLAGRGRWVPWAGLAAFAVAGLLVLIVTGRYVAGRRRLAESQARQQAILATAPDAFVGINETGTITDWNTAAAALFGWDPGEVIGRPVTEVLIPQRYKAAHVAGLDRFLQTGLRSLPDTAVTVAAAHRDGREIPVELVLAPLRWGLGWRFHAFLRDITARLAAEQEVRSLAAIVASSDDAIYTRHTDGSVASWNRGAERLLGYPAAEIVGLPTDRLVPPAHRHTFQIAVDRVADGQHVGHFHTLHRRRDGTDVEVSVAMSPLRDAADAVVGVSLSARDITAAQAHAEELLEAEERFRLAFDLVPVAMALTSLDPADPGRVVRANATFCRLLGYTEEELQSRTFGDITHPDDSDHPWLVSGAQTTASFERRYLHRDGTTIWALVNTAVVDAAAGQPHYAVTHIQDITADRAETDRLRMMALSDPLTGLANRLLFQDRLTHAVHRAERHDRTLAVVYCDLDGFKVVNDEFGHAVGDEVLRAVAHRLREATRPSDTVARLGGDEFAVLCEDLTCLDVAKLVAERIRTNVEGTYLASIGTLQVGCSVGLATAVGPRIDPAALVELADRNMFINKRKRPTHRPTAAERPS